LKLIIEKYWNNDRIDPLNADFIKNALVQHGIHDFNNLNQNDAHEFKEKLINSMCIEDQTFEDM
jgi:hypothetical protein